MKTKNIRKTILGALGAAAWLASGAITAQAQDGPPQGFDPAQMRQRMMERMRDQLGVSDDSEWKLISDRIAKVMETRRAAGGMGGMGGFMRPPGGFGGPGGFRGPGGPPGAGGNDQPNPDNPPGPPPGAGGGFGRGPGGPGPGFGRPASPELEALNKAIESKASSDELKARMADVRAAREKNQTALLKAQQDLKQLLSVRQEAVAMTLGLVN